MKRIELLKQFIIESDLIENIKDDPDFVKEELKNGKKDGHVGAILFCAQLAKDKNRSLSEADIKKVQGLITEEQGKKRADLKLKPEWIGDYRNINVGVGGRTCPHYHQVPELMKGLVLQIQEWQKCWQEFSEIQNLAMLADYHYDFEMIHPFADGNGRAGRAIIFYLMLYMNRRPFIFTNFDKYDFYYPPLQIQNKKMMRHYFYRKTGNLT